jgi:hypothetical protein
MCQVSLGPERLGEASLTETLVKMMPRVASKHMQKEIYNLVIQHSHGKSLISGGL